MIVYDIMNKITIISLTTHICAYLVEYCRVVSLKVTMKFQKKQRNFLKSVKVTKKKRHFQKYANNTCIFQIFTRKFLKYYIYLTINRGKSSWVS